MGKRKIDILVNKIFEGYKGKEVSKFQEQNSDKSVKDFIENRLGLHGPKGYLFHGAEFYKKVYFETRNENDISLIANYVHDKNTFRKRI